MLIVIIDGYSSVCDDNSKTAADIFIFRIWSNMVQNKNIYSRRIWKAMELL